MIRISATAFIFALALLSLAACTPEGYPSTDTEMVVVGVIVCVFALVLGFCVWCVTRK